MDLEKPQFAQTVFLKSWVDSTRARISVKKSSHSPSLRLVSLTEGVYTRELVKPPVPGSTCLLGLLQTCYSPVQKPSMGPHSPPEKFKLLNPPSEPLLGRLANSSGKFWMAS